MITPDRLAIAPEVADALRDGTPVVALESTLISHGLPYPQNVEVATASEAAVRSSGAVPATVALNRGRLLVGLVADELEALATAPKGTVRKVSRPEPRAGDRVWRMGRDDRRGDDDRGRIGGHPGVRDRRHRRRAPRGAGRGTGAGTGHATFDISADLDELARTPVAVVCAGPKAILDVPLTLEYLETRGVPVVSVGIDEVPGFYSRLSGIPAPSHVPDIAAAAAVIRAHEAMGLTLRARHLQPGPGGRRPPPRHCPGRDRAGDPRGGRGRDLGCRRDALAPGPRRRDHGRRLGQGEHLADHEQRAGRRAPGGGADRRLTPALGPDAGTRA